MTTPTQQDREKAREILSTILNSEKPDSVGLIAQAIAAERTRVIEELRAWAHANDLVISAELVVSFGDLLAQLDAMAKGTDDARL